MSPNCGRSELCQRKSPDGISRSTRSKRETGHRIHLLIGRLEVEDYDREVPWNLGEGCANRPPQHLQKSPPTVLKPAGAPSPRAPRSPFLTWVPAPTERPRRSLACPSGADTSPHVLIPMERTRPS